MRTQIGRPALILLSLVMATASLQAAEFALNRCFSDNMVLQREKPVKVWGRANKGEAITITFAGQSLKTVTDKTGKWAVVLEPMAANATPQSLMVQGDKDKISLKGVVIGDVFLFARQSSIDVTLGSKPAGKKAASSYVPNQKVRFMRIITTPAKAPLDDLSKDATDGWKIMDKGSVLTMSAAAFYLARDMAKKIGVPLGIIDLDMGYHFSSAWLSQKGKQEVQARIGEGEMGAFNIFIKELPENIVKWEKAAEGKKPRVGLSPWEEPCTPYVCYNAVIHPMRGIALKGMLLQLGNDYTMVAYNILRKKGKYHDRASLDKAYSQSYTTYKRGVAMSPEVLPIAPGDLRRSLGEKSLPIGWIMPPGSDFHDYAIHNREIRELQRRTQLETDNLDLILPGTEHIPMSGQPADEALLASRCSQWVMGTFYDKQATVSGPLCDHVEYNPEKGEGTIFFKPGTAEGLSAKGEVLGRFEVGSSDGIFVPCEARIEGDTIKLYGDNLPAIIFARFNWSKKPAQGLANSAGLPAVPFNTYSGWKLDWWPESAPVELPMEYHTIAGDWPDRDIAIFNGANKLASGDTQPNPNNLGSTGIIAAPFGPNLYVHKITPGSPVDGKVLPDDIIYGVNGENFETAPDDKYRQFSAGITHSESYAGEGKMTLKIRRKGKNIVVPIQLEVLGSYSATTPWNCAKSRRIVANAERWVGEHLRPAKGMPKALDSDRYPLNGDMLFLLASGNPDDQGMVRREVYRKMSEMESRMKSDMDPSLQEIKPGGSNWNLSYNGLLFGEYYHRTGDKNVLPCFKYITDKITRHQYRSPGADLTKYAVAKFGPRTGGWYSGWNQTLPGYGRLTYGLMSALGMVCVMDLKLAKDAGVDVDKVSLKQGIVHFNDRRAEYGHVPYGISYVDGPPPIDPVADAKGMGNSWNGKLGTSAALFTVVQDEGAYKATVEITSRSCVYAFNNTRHGHGGMNFNNYWTPIGAHLAGEKGFRYFMKNQTWWRELYRRYDGSFAQVPSAGIGTGFAIHRVAPHKRLRMLGAPRSAFSTNPPDYLKPALAAHAKRDYALAVKLIQKELDEQVIGGEELRVVKHFLESMQTLRKSVEYDLDYVDTLVKRKRYYLASLELPQLTGVVNPTNPRLIAITKALATSEAMTAAAQGKKAKERAEKEAKALKRQKPKKPVDSRKWVTLVKDGYQVKKGRIRTTIFPPEEQNLWRMKVLETRYDAPKEWVTPDFDDSKWDQTRLPIQWHVSHAVLLRTTFTVDDKDAYDAIRIAGRFWHHRNVEVFLNGELVAKANLGAPASMPLTPYAMELLKEGTNTLAVTTLHDRRWMNRWTSEGGLSVRLEFRKKNNTDAK